MFDMASDFLAEETAMTSVGMVSNILQRIESCKCGWI